MTRIAEPVADTGSAAVRPRRARKVLTGSFGAAAVWFLCCVVPILLVGGGAAAVTDGLVREGLLMLPFGVAAIAAGVGYVAIRRARRRRAARR